MRVHLPLSIFLHRNAYPETSEKLHLKHGHVEIADFDNDGWPDILVAATYRDDDVSLPFVCRNVSNLPTDPKQTGITMPKFQVPPVEKADAYFAVGPVGDYDVMVLTGHSSFTTAHKFHLAKAEDLIHRARAATAQGLRQKLVHFSAGTF
jgi:hypothetical protein